MSMASKTIDMTCHYYFSFIDISIPLMSSAERLRIHVHTIKKDMEYGNYA